MIPWEKQTRARNGKRGRKPLSPYSAFGKVWKEAMKKGIKVRGGDTSIGAMMYHLGYSENEARAVVREFLDLGKFTDKWTRAEMEEGFMKYYFEAKKGAKER